MRMFISPRQILPFLLPITLPLSIHAQVSGSGSTTRYFDCCKPSCGYPGKLTPAPGSNVVQSCDIHDTPLADYNAQSGCIGGNAYTCSDQTPWAVSDTLAYGFAAVNIAGGSEASWCCACYELTFTSGTVQGKKMVVQATNTGGDLNGNQFDLAIPGGGFGIYDACTTEWSNTSTDWGARYGGISNRAQCDTFPDPLKPGCYWRFDWFQNADNPSVNFKQVSCPAALTARTGCVRADDQGSVGSSVIPTSPGSTAGISSSSTKASVGTSTSSPVIGTGSSGIVPAYGQCGGKNWNGGTQCVAGYTCIPQSGNPYYSQCLPTPAGSSSSSSSPPIISISSSSSSLSQTSKSTSTSKTSGISTLLSNSGPTPTPSSAPSSTPGSGSGTVVSYGQCGGLGWSGSTTCGAGHSCKVVNPYYSQCIPNPTEAGTVPSYGQCGGMNYVGATICTAGYTCRVVNPYYSQCLPS